MNDIYPEIKEINERLTLLQRKLRILINDYNKLVSENDIDDSKIEVIISSRQDIELVLKEISLLLRISELNSLTKFQLKRYGFENE